MFFYRKLSQFRRRILAASRRVRPARWLWRIKLVASWVSMWKCVPVLDWIRAAESYCSESYRQAAYYYDRALRHKPNHPASDCARLDLAYCLYRLGEKERIVNLLSPLVKRRVKLSQVYILLSKVLIQMGKCGIAQSVTARGCEVFPNSVEMLVAHVFASLFGGQDHAAALPHLINKVMQMEEQKDKDSSIKFALKKVNAQPEIYLNQADSDSISKTQKAIKAQIRTALAWVEHLHGDSAAAEAFLADAVFLGAESVELYLLLSERQFEERRISTAREMLSEAIRVDPSDPRPLCEMAKSYLRDGGQKDAQASLFFASKACQLSSWINLEYLVVLRQAYEGCGDFDAAELISLRLEKLSISGKIGFDSVKFALANLEDLQLSFQTLSSKSKELH